MRSCMRSLQNDIYRCTDESQLRHELSEPRNLSHANIRVLISNIDQLSLPRRLKRFFFQIHRCKVFNTRCVDLAETGKDKLNGWGCFLRRFFGQLTLRLWLHLSALTRCSTLLQCLSCYSSSFSGDGSRRSSWRLRFFQLLTDLLLQLVLRRACRLVRWV